MSMAAVVEQVLVSVRISEDRTGRCGDTLGIGRAQPVVVRLPRTGRESGRHRPGQRTRPRSAVRTGASQFTVGDSPDFCQDMTARRAALREVSRGSRHLASTRWRQKCHESDPPTRSSCFRQADTLTPTKESGRPPRKPHVGPTSHVPCSRPT